MWKFTGQEKPPFAIEPEDGQESVWDYPRPPAISVETRDIQVYLNFVKIAQTRSAIKVMETASPPTFYINPDDVDTDLLKLNRQSSFCEWKGQAKYYDFFVKSMVVNSVCWFYPNPTNYFEKIKEHLAFYPSKVQCYINGERVKSQKGGFYGGWITNEIVGPFKGDPETLGW